MAKKSKWKGAALSLLGSIPFAGKVKKGIKAAKKAAKTLQKKAQTTKKKVKASLKKAKNKGKKKKKKKKKKGKVFTKARKLLNNLSKKDMLKKLKKGMKKTVLAAKKIQKKAVKYVKVNAKEIASFAVDMVPYVGTVKGFQQTTTGVDLITGQSGTIKIDDGGQDLTDSMKNSNMLMEKNVNNNGPSEEKTPNHWIKNEKGALVGEYKPKDTDGWFGHPLAYGLDLKIPTSLDALYSDIIHQEKIGGEVKFAVVDAGKDLRGTSIHEQLIAAEAKLQYDSTGVQAKAGATFQDIGIDDYDGDYKAHFKVGTAEAGAEIKDGHISAGAKADVAKIEGEVKIDLPDILNIDLVVGGNLAFGSIGGEAKFGLENEVSVGVGLFGVGGKLSFEPDKE